MTTEIKHIAVLGAGLMGHGIAQIFLAGGFRVSLFDPNADVLNAAPSKIKDIFSLFDESDDCVNNLSCCASMSVAVKDADLVIEAGPEKLDVKQEIFKSLSSECKPSAILATNTSAIPIKDVGALMEDASRVVGTHFWNPPYLVRLVEVVQSETADIDCVTSTINVLEKVAMKAVHVKRDIPGFIGNRLQHAMKREAIAMVADGVCDAETIDTVVKHGFGARLAVLGPLEQSDLVGLEMTAEISRVLYPTLDNTSDVPELVADKIQQGMLGMKTGEGFRQWTPEAAQEVRDALQNFLAAQSQVKSKI